MFPLWQQKQASLGNLHFVMAETAEWISVTLVRVVGFIFEIGFHHVALDSLELAKLTRLTSSSSQVLRLIRVCYHACLRVLNLKKKIKFLLGYQSGRLLTWGDSLTPNSLVPICCWFLRTDHQKPVSPIVRSVFLFLSSTTYNKGHISSTDKWWELWFSKAVKMKTGKHQARYRISAKMPWRAD